jgi:4-hydroxy-tetrahydrodipicolinate synthase
MTTFEHLRGVYCAAVTPLTSDFRVDTQAIPLLLEFLADRGCNGALLLGTTGEGPSFASYERLAILQAALNYRTSLPGFRILAGTATPSLEETIQLTRTAFELGVDGVVVLPPYYYRKVSDEGLFDWFSQVIRQAVPDGKAFFGYHIPPVTGVPLSIELLGRLKESFPSRFAGLKDSSSDPEQARLLGTVFEEEIMVFSGNDRLFSLALKHHSAGCITALANLCSPDLARVWNAFQQGQDAIQAQARLEAARRIMENYTPFPPFIKAMLSYSYHFPFWPVRPPLSSLPIAAIENGLVEMDKLCES